MNVYLRVPGLNEVYLRVPGLVAKQIKANDEDESIVY